MKTLGTLFSGFGGFDCGAHAAGLQSAWGIEYDAAIADVARMNGLPVQTMDVMEADPNQFAWVNWLHASPPCPNFSAAKANAVETTHDLALAMKVAEFVTVMKPDVFSLENVRAYEKSRSFKLIVDALFEAGYWPQWSVLNAADFGVPQTRERLILRATRGAMPAPLPEPVPWVGWYAAIEDIIHTLPESKFADWQLKRLPSELTTFIVDGQNQRETGIGLRVGADPVMTVVSADKGMPRAFIANTNMSGNDGDGMALAYADEPTFTVTTSAEGRLRAFLMESDSKAGMVAEAEPAPTQVAGRRGIQQRAFLVDNLNVTREATVRMEDAPAFSIVAGAMRRPASTPNAWLSHGRVVQMTPRALARFQSFPDSYQLPTNRTLACKGIGNAVPSLLAQRIVEATL